MPATALLKRTGSISIALLVSVFAILLLSLLILPAAQSNNHIVDLSTNLRGESLINKISYLPTDKELNFAEVRALDTQGQFKLLTTTLNSDSTRNHEFWFKIQVQAINPNGQWVLDTGFFALRKFAVYGPFKEGDLYDVPQISAGTGIAINSQRQLNDHFSYLFQLEKPGVHTIYLNTSSDFALHYDIKIWDSVNFSKKELTSNFLSGLCYGLLVAIFLCNVVMCIAFKERLYAYNSLSTLFALLTLSTFSGHVPQYLPFLATPFLYALVQVFPLLWMMFGSKFARHFLDLKRYAPRLNTLLYYLENFGLFTLTLLLLQIFSIGLALKSISALLGTIGIFSAAVIAYRKGFLPARWYLAGLGTLFLAVIGIAISNYNLIEFISQNTVLQVGVVLDGFFFLVALGSRIRRIRDLSGLFGDEPLNAPQQKHIDPLTGAKNEKGWKKLAPKILVQGAKSAILKISVSESNADVSSALINAISREVGEHDLYARNDKNEFFVLFSSVPSKDVLCVRTELIIEDFFRKINAPIDTPEIKTCIGIAYFPADGKDVNSLMDAADKAMHYVLQGKTSGYAFYDELE